MTYKRASDYVMLTYCNHVHAILFQLNSLHRVLHIMVASCKLIPCHPFVTLVVVSSAYITFKNGAVPKLHLPNTIDTGQTMTSKISLDADHVIKMHSIELVEGAAQETEDRV